MVTTKQKRSRLSSDKDFLNKLISILEKEKMTKEELAQKLGMDGAKKVTDSILLSAVKLAGNSVFLSNILEKVGGRVKSGPQYSVKRGLVVPAYMFDGKDVSDGQKYEMNYGIRTGIITLKPIVE
jgi:hypothetical protein